MTELKLTDQNIKEFERATQQEMDKTIKHFEKELVTIRTGRAHPGLVEDILVTCYGSTTLKLREVSSITTPEARLIVIQPWDQSTINDIEKSISMSDLGVKPVNDGNLIRIVLPEMSTSRREELKKVLSKKSEDNRISIRNARKIFHNLIRDSEKAKSISEDHARRLSELLQKITDIYIKKIDDMAAKKEQEIGQV